MTNEQDLKNMIVGLIEYIFDCTDYWNTHDDDDKFFSYVIDSARNFKQMPNESMKELVNDLIECYNVDRGLRKENND